MLDIVKDSTGLDVVLYAPSLPRSIVHAPRHAVPIYPADAQTIVNLMDINVERPDLEDESQTCDEPFEVFEAGTGAGSLTVHIAKALHAGNPGLPRDLREGIAGASLSLDDLLSRSGVGRITQAKREERPGRVDEVKGDSCDEALPEGDAGQISATETPSSPEGDMETSPAAADAPPSIRDPKSPTSPNFASRLATTTIASLPLPDAAKSLADAYLPRRRAILHTLDRNPKHTHAAHALIHGFKRGMYLPNIDFHAGLIPEYLTQRLDERDGRPFLSRVVLDLPTASEYAELLIQCMHVNATLTLFTPSISQIASFESWSSTTGQPLVQDRVVELPTDSSDGHGVMGKEGGRPWKVKTVVPKRRDDGAALVQIMRPLVGERVAGGGFVGLYRKMRRVSGGDLSEEDHQADQGVEG